ncbi:hypothetical protein, partial [Natrialba sp. PRR66]|uniref:hypothetical protein n=1 Tax=Natrialba sp. PRR66 TaxID=3098146 RepID=UPI002B1D3F19
SSGGDEETELDEASTTTATASQHHHQQHQQHQQECYTMDQLWNEIAAAEAEAGYVADSWGAGHHHGAAVELPSPVWEFCWDYSLWRIDDE